MGKYTKLPWAIASLLSLIYAIDFYNLATTSDASHNLLLGFCVWVTPELPAGETSCENSHYNSHKACFIADVILTFAVVVIYVLDQNETKKKLTYISFGFIILSHGLLHWALDAVVHCYTPDTVDHEPGGTVLFTIFSFILALIIIGEGFNGLTLPNLVLSAIFTLAVLVVKNMTKADRGGSQQTELILPALFVISHPLSCIVGLFTSNPAFNEKAGWLFAISTLVGIFELTQCEPILKPIGGHVW